MFEISVGELLASYEGDTRTLEFSDMVAKENWDDLVITEPLNLTIRLTHIQHGIEVYFLQFNTQVIVDGIEYEVDIPPFERVFNERIDTSNPESLDIINKKSGTIDLSHILREEILMYIHY